MPTATGAGDVSLAVENLVKVYGNGVTIGPITFSVRQGEFFSLLGPSGCGKSTTLRCIAGFENATSGTMRLNGDRLNDVPPFKRHLGLVFQSFALFPHLSVAANVGFGLKLRKVAPAETERRVEETLSLVGLQGLGERMPSQISGGQQQRVALARALVLEPPLLLLDEPLSSLDLKLRQQMRDELRTLQRRLGQTMIFVTHDQTEALAMSDRVAVLDDGHIEQIGTPREIYSTPASRFVADFIGQANLFQATVVSRDGAAATLRLPGEQLIRAKLPDNSTMSPGDEVCAVVRPENVRMTAPSTLANGANVLAGTLADQEYLGENIQLRVDVAGVGSVLVSQKTTRRSAEHALGAPLNLEVDAEDVFVLPG